MVHRRSRRRRKARRNNNVISPNRKRYGRRRKARNAGRGLSLGRPVSMLTAGYKPSNITKAVPVAIGAFTNFMARNKVSAMLGLGPVWTSGLGSYAVGLATAGLHLMVPRYGQQLFSGAVLEELMRAGKDMLAKAGITGFSGQGEYFTQQEAARMQGLGHQGEYFTQGEAASLSGSDDDGLDGMNEFLTEGEEQDAMFE